MRLIDADGLKERLKEYCVDGDKGIEEYYEIMGIDDCIDNAPTVDAVEVVRCKDCKHMKYAIDKAKNGMCGVHSALIIMNGNDYCSYGERKKE